MYPFDSPDSPFNAPFNPTMIPTRADSWSLNPYYLTPSYTAPYRPNYEGYEGFYDNYAYSPGFAGAFNNINPLSRNQDPYYSSVASFNDRNWMEMSSGIVDRGVDLAQSIGSPVLASIVANKMFNMRVKTADRYAATWAKFSGGNVRQAMRGSSSLAYYMGGRFGKGVGKAVFNTLGRVLPGSLTSTVGYRGFQHAALRTAYGIGGIAATGVIPLLAGEMMLKGAQELAFDPYIDTRNMQDALKREFQNTYMGNVGTPITGMGLGGASSGKFSSALVGEGIKDIRFNGGGEYAQMLTSSLQSGLFSNVGILNSGEVVNRVKSAADQALLVMRIAKEPSVQNAIKQVGELMKMGADPLTGAVRNAMTSLGMSSHTAGISTQNMMSTTGLQGQYMFQSAGMIPYVGQIASASSRAAMISGYRSGLISPALMAMMGGHEGATQSAVQGLMTGMASPYSQIMLANKYMFGGGSKGLTGNLMDFSHNFARDPVNTAGLMALNQGIMQSYDINKNGIAGVMTQVTDIATRMGLMKKGKLGAGAAHQIMQSMGMSQDQIVAILNQARSISSPQSLQLQVGSMNAASLDNYMQFLNQEQVIGMSRFFAPARRAYRRAVEYGSRYAREIPSWLGGLSDAGSEAFTNIQYGSSHSKDTALLNSLGIGGQREEGELTTYTPSDMLNDDFWGTVSTGGKIGLKLFRDLMTGNKPDFSVDDALRTLPDETRLKVIRGQVKGFRVGQRKSKFSNFDSTINEWARKDLSGATDADAEAIRAARQLASFGFSREKDKGALMSSLRTMSRVTGHQEWLDQADDLLHYNFRKFTGSDNKGQDHFITMPSQVTSPGQSMELFDKLEELSPGMFSKDVSGFLKYASSLGLAKQIFANGQGISGSDWLSGEGKEAVKSLGKALGYGENADPEKVYQAARSLMLVSAHTDTTNANALIKGVARKKGESDADYLKRAVAEKGKVGITLGGAGATFPTSFASDETALRHVQNMDADSDARERLRQGYNASQLDFQGYITAEASIEFRTAVREFGQHVKNMSGNGSTARPEDPRDKVLSGSGYSPYHLFSGLRTALTPKQSSTAAPGAAVKPD